MDVFSSLTFWIVYWSGVVSCFLLFCAVQNSRSLRHIPPSVRFSMFLIALFHPIIVIPLMIYSAFFGVDKKR